MSDIWKGMDSIRKRSFNRYSELYETRQPIYGCDTLAEVVRVDGKPVFRMSLNNEDPRVEQVLEFLFKVPKGLCRGSFFEDAETINLEEDWGGSLYPVCR